MARTACAYDKVAHMTNRSVLLPVLLACTLPLGAQSTTSPHSQVSGTAAAVRESDRVALTALVDRFSTAVNAKDAAALAACFTEDGEFTNPVGMTEKGRAAIQAFHAMLFAPVRQPNTPSFYYARLKVLSSNLRMVRPDVASVDVRWQQDGAIAPDGSPWGTRTGILSWVAVRDHGAWLVAVWHNMELPKTD